MNMLHLFEYETLILLNQVKSAEKVNHVFQYPLYQKKATIIFLLHYKTIKNDWLPPVHQELFEKIIRNAFHYSLEEIAAYNAEEIIQNPQITLDNQPNVIFYMDNKPPTNTILKWLQEQKCEIYYLPSLTQMIENQEFKQQAWKEIKNYLNKN